MAYEESYGDLKPETAKIWQELKADLKRSAVLSKEFQDRIEDEMRHIAQVAYGLGFNDGKKFQQQKPQGGDT